MTAARAGRVGWYGRRLRAMSPAEVAWRAAGVATARLPRRTGEDAAPRWTSGPWPRLLDRLVETAPPLADDARLIAAGRLELWGRPVVVDPEHPAWDAHPFAGETWPAGSWRRWGLDPKPVWELNRQQHLVPLAVAGATGRRRAWSRLALAQLLDWVDASPGPSGPGWASPYETAHRLVGWAWTVPLAAGAASRGELDVLAAAYERQARFVRSRPSRYSSANNHRLAELAGLLAACLLSGRSAGWDDLWGELEHEAAAQTHPDGGSREQAAGYFLYVLEILWVALLFALAAGRPAGRVATVVASMLEWLHAAGDAVGEPPPVGDDAEDRMLRLDYGAPRSAAAIAYRTAAALAGRPTLSLPGRPPAHAAGSVLLRDSGYAILRCRTGGEEARVVVDVGALGFGSLAAHGHADALSVLVDVGGRTVLRDAGTGAYAPAGAREPFRATAAHNTVTVDGESQARPLGPHLWGARYRVRVDLARLEPGLDVVRASHDGYLRGRRGALHARTVALLHDAALVVVLDRVSARAGCAAELRWHGPPGAGGGHLSVAAVPPAEPTVEESPWSERYGSIGSAPCWVWRAAGREIVFVTVVSLTAGDAPPVRLRLPGGRARLELGRPAGLVVRETAEGGLEVTA